MTLGDGSVVTLREPHYSATDLAYGPLADDVMLSPRVANPMIGLGLVEQIPAEDVLAHADPDDANGDGVADQADGKPVPYNAWTPRLLKAAYNWKFVSSDAGIHVHNPHYALELLYDSMEDLAGPVGIDFAALKLVR